MTLQGRYPLDILESFPWMIRIKSSHLSECTQIETLFLGRAAGDARRQTAAKESKVLNGSEGFDAEKKSCFSLLVFWKPRWE